jgi:hypothetical protein
MTIDDRIRAAFEELAPVVSSDGVLAALEERLATPPPPPPRPRRRWWRSVGGAAVVALLIALSGVAIRGGPDDAEELGQAPSATTSASEAEGGTPTRSGSVPSSTSMPPIDPGPVLAPVPPATPTPAVPVVRDDAPGSSFPSVPWASVPADADPLPPSSTTTTTTTITTTTTTPTTTTSRPTYPSPIVVDGTLSEGEVWELDAAACTRAVTVTVSVRVIDDLGLATVVADPGVVGGKAFALAPTTGDRYEGTLGPWPVGTVPFGLSLPVSVTVTATNTAGQVGELVVGAFLIRSVSTC